VPDRTLAQSRFSPTIWLAFFLRLYDEKVDANRAMVRSFGGSMEVLLGVIFDCLFEGFVVTIPWGCLEGDLWNRYFGIRENFEERNRRSDS